MLAPPASQVQGSWPKGVRPLLLAQFLSALADNAILILAIASLQARDAPGWMTPFLKFFFMASFVAFAFCVGAIADRWPKARVMMMTNALKALGCGLLLAGAHPLAAYALIGLGAAAYSPAKYGLLLELLPARYLVTANAWLEGLTLGSVILGTVAGGALVSPEFANWASSALAGWNIVGAEPLDRAAALPVALGLVLCLYLAAALVNTQVPTCSARCNSVAPSEWAPRFIVALRAMLADGEGRVSLLATTLLWGVGAAMQFVVLDWGRERMGLTLDRASMLQGAVAVGVAIGAVLAARCITLARTLSVLPLGMLLGPVVAALLFVRNPGAAAVVLVLVGLLSGFFIVPMNALMQHRGHVLTQPGQAIAVQNFCENISIMAMVALYAGLREWGWAVSCVTTLLAVGTATAMLALTLHARRQRTLPGVTWRV